MRGGILEEEIKLACNSVKQFVPILRLRDGRFLFVLRYGEDRLLFYDLQGRVRAVLEGWNYTIPARMEFAGVQEDYFSLTSSEGVKHIYEIVENPFAFWWFWRGGLGFIWSA